LLLLLGAGCSGDRDRLTQDLKSDHPEIRAGALHKLAELHASQDLPSFIAKSTDLAPMVRKASAEALGSTLDPRAVDVLGTLLGDPDDEVQAAAARALAKIPGEKASGYLLNNYARRGTATRAAIAEAFEYGPKLQEAIRREADRLWERSSKALENGGAAERVAAAQELGRSGKPEAVERLIPLLGNDAILLAAGAARGLGEAGDRKAVPSLMAVLKENYPPLREAAAEALGDLGDPQALPLLLQVASGADAAATDAAAALARLPRSADTDAALCQVASSAANAAAVNVAALAMASRGGCALAPLLARLGKGSADTRAALVALAALDAGKPEVVSKLARPLEDKDSQVRFAAVAALGAVAQAEAAPPLLDLATAESKRLDDARAKWIAEPLPTTFAPGFSEPAPSADPAFAQKLSALEGKVREVTAAKAAAAGQVLHASKAEPVPELLPDLAPDDGRLLGLVAAALGRTRAPEAAALLAKLASDGDDDVREGALVGLAYLGGAGLAKVQASWAELSPDAVPQVAGALEQGGATAVPVLLAGLQARSADRASIASALGTLGAKEAVEPLEKLLGSPGDECAAAAGALGKLGQARSVKPLMALLDDPRSAGRIEAIEALGKIKDPAGRPAVVRELFSDRPESRAAAVRALAALGAGPAASELDALRADYYREVRRAAEQVLGGTTASK